MNAIKILLLTVLLYACQFRQDDSKLYLKSGKSIDFEYAKGLKIIEFDDHYYIKVQTPNDSLKVFGEYILYKDQKPEIPFPIDGYVKIPVQKTAPLSTTHIGFISKLNQEASVAGVTDPFRIYNAKVRKALSQNKIADLGQSLSTDIEKVIALSPDVVIESGFPNASNKNQTLKQAGIPVIYTVEWMEASSLARAEWLKLFGYLYDDVNTANKLFSDIAKEYNRLKTTVALPEKSPTVFAGNSFKGVWYLPGGNSYVAKLIKDAGGSYIMENDTSTASMPVSFEVVFDEISDANIWINVEESTLSSLTAMDERLKLFPPVINGNVFNRNLKSDGSGANSYFEDAICNPHKILSDLILIFHPELQGEKQTLNYYSQLKDE